MRRVGRRDGIVAAGSAGIRAAGALVLASLPTLAAGTTAEFERHEYRRLVMGTQARIVLYAPDDAVARTAAAAAFARMVELDDLLTDWRPSELTRLGEAAGGPPTVVSPDLFHVLHVSGAVAEASEGAFDVTVGPLTKLWRATRAAGELPTAEVLAEAQARTGWGNVVLDAETGSVALTVARMELDLGAIGKGYACDQALETLEEHGVTRALVEIGGDMVCGDPPPDRDGWRVAAACGTERTPAPLLVLAREAVATSGDTEQHVVIDGVRYSHILDPRTGLGLTESECVTVVAPSGALADALASAVSVRGIAASGDLLARFDARVPQATRQRPPLGEWTELFDGKTLAGWTTRGGRYDGDAIWTVEDGVLTGRVGPNNAGGLLYTEREYTSFEFECETKIDYPFDSGIFLRMVPRGGGKGAQVTLDYRPDGEVGGIYADGWLQHNPHGKGKWKEGDWNHFRVRCTGFDMHVEVWMNGEQITDYRVPAGETGFAPRGLIGVQVHGGRDDPGRHAARFRNVRVRELPVFDDGLLEPASAAHPELLRLTAKAGTMGWKPLFDGKSLAGWNIAGRRDLYSVQDGVLSLPARTVGGHLETAQDYSDFRLRLDFQVPRLGNSGVFLRAVRGEPNPTESGCEIQILDDFNWEAVTGSVLQPWQFTGSLYGALSPGDRTALRPVGEWNIYEILYQGRRLAVALNGITLYDVDTTTLDPALGLPFARRAKTGFIGLQTHGSNQAAAGDVLCFRNLFLQEL